MSTSSYFFVFCLLETHFTLKYVSKAIFGLAPKLLTQATLLDTLNPLKDLKTRKKIMNTQLNKRLYTEQDVKQAWQLIEKAQKITLLSHQNPDADGISACTALAHILEKMGKTIEAVYPSKPEFEQTRTV